MDENKKLNNPPLKLVLAEFRFSPVMQIVDYISIIQEKLRREYPIFHKISGQSVQVQAQEIAVHPVYRWVFLSADKQSAVEINQERLIYTVAEYSGFKEFSMACRQALEILADIVEPSLILRVGLRYSDLVIIDEEEELSVLVDKHFGFPSWIAGLGAEPQQDTQCFLKTEMGRLIIRTLYGENNLTILPDLQGLPVQIKTDPIPSERIILDFDHIWEAGEKSISFATNEVLNTLSSLHKTIKKAFEQITTDHAREEKWA